MNHFSIAIFLLVVVLAMSACRTSRTGSSRQSAELEQLERLSDSLEKLQKVKLRLTPDSAITYGNSLPQQLVYPIPPDTFKIVGVGDIMLGTNFPKPHYLPPNRGRDLLKDVYPHLRNAHLTFGNLEGVVLNDGGDPKHCNNPDACYLFRMPEYLMEPLMIAGFDVVSLANNHSGDFGLAGRKNTMRTLDSLGIYYAGLVQQPFTTFNLHGKKIGFIAFAPNSGTVSIHDEIYAQSSVQHLDSICDYVIVSFHGGAEGKDHEHVTRQPETYYGEDRGNVYAFAHQLIDAGADVIFGHGPHVTRAVEVYKNKFIAYSLGNFCTYARFNLQDPNGIAPIIKLFLNAQGDFLKGEIVPVRQIDRGVPVTDPDDSVIKKLKELIKTDFPETEIFIDDLGRIQYIQREI